MKVNYHSITKNQFHNRSTECKLFLMSVIRVSNY